MASSSSASAEPVKAPRSPESFEALRWRNIAAEILQSYERLSWYSFQRCESLAQTRIHFQNVMAGLSDEDEAALVDWPEDHTPRPRPGDEEQKSRKGKARVSSGSAGGGDGVAGSSAQKSVQHRERSDGASAKKKRKSAG